MDLQVGKFLSLLNEANPVKLAASTSSSFMGKLSWCLSPCISHVLCTLLVSRFNHKLTYFFPFLVQPTQRAIKMGETRVIKSVVMVMPVNSTVQNIGVPSYNGAAMLITG